MGAGALSLDAEAPSAVSVAADAGPPCGFAALLAESADGGAENFCFATDSQPRIVARCAVLCCAAVRFAAAGPLRRLCYCTSSEQGRWSARRERRGQRRRSPAAAYRTLSLGKSCHMWQEQDPLLGSLCSCWPTFPSLWLVNGTHGLCVGHPYDRCILSGCRASRETAAYVTNASTSRHQQPWLQTRMAAPMAYRRGGL